MKCVLWNGMSKIDVDELRKKDDYSLSGTKIQKRQTISILKMGRKYRETQSVCRLSFSVFFNFSYSIEKNTCKDTYTCHTCIQQGVCMRGLRGNLTTCKRT